MSYKISELRSKSDDELIEQHDRQAEHTLVGTEYYVQEIARRDAAGQTTMMLHLTRTMSRLTWLIAILTAINVILIAWEVLR